MTASKQWLRDLFVCFGTITDIFLSKKLKRSTSLHFAFVRLLFEYGARRAIKALNGEAMDASRLVVVAAFVRNYVHKHLSGGKTLAVPRVCFGQDTSTWMVTLNPPLFMLSC